MSAKSAKSTAAKTAPVQTVPPPAHAPEIQPYLFFEGRCEEAIEFYRRAVGAEVKMLMRYKDSPEPGTTPPELGDKVLHAEIRVGGSTVLFSDGRCTGPAKFEGFALSLTVRDATAAERYFHALADGGQVQMPMAKTFFSERFGMATDRFGVLWMIYVAPQGA